jgi:hypothetical protein
MPENEQERFRIDLAIALSIVGQRRSWIFRELTHRDRTKAAAAREALIGEIMAVAADYALRKTREPLKAHSTP